MVEPPCECNVSYLTVLYAHSESFMIIVLFARNVARLGLQSPKKRDEKSTSPANSIHLPPVTLDKS